MAQVYNPQWQAMMAIDQELFDLMASKNFQPAHTGGGCFAWERPTDDDGSIIITLEVELGEWQDRDKPEWDIGRYHNNDFVMVAGLTLGKALEIADTLYAPRENEETTITADDYLCGRLAMAFVQLLHKALTPAQFEEMRERNRAEQGEGICHSHDFLDANEVMAEACEEMGIPLFNAKGEIEDKATELWNKAWQLAMPHLR